MSHWAWSYKSSPEIIVEYVRLRALGIAHQTAARQALVVPEDQERARVNLRATIDNTRMKHGFAREEWLNDLKNSWRSRLCP